MTVARAAIVAAARQWLGTPYHHCADIKGVGVDCGMLLVRVFVDAGACPPFDPRPYTFDWMLFRSEENFLANLLERAERVATPLPGDVILFKVGRCYSHGAIVTATDPLTILHAAARNKQVLEEPLAAITELADRLDTAVFARMRGVV